ncbi:MAG: CBS domain-containing protein [Deltaproteobacteria bacterium]|nr:CBS domain-containing protein [Deltaproteobacteria bacterium]
MPQDHHSDILSKLTVQDAMRRLVVRLQAHVSIADAIRQMIRFKVNAVLVTDEKNEAVGVVSKTNILGAYYAYLPLVTPLSEVLVAPVLFCSPNDSLDKALERMRAHNVHRLYVAEQEIRGSRLVAGLLGADPSRDSPSSLSRRAAGVLAYTDIAGLLYRYCHKCPRSTLRGTDPKSNQRLSDHLRVGEVMTASVLEHRESDLLGDVMESVFRERVRLALMRDEKGLPTGVISTSDLIIAYLHGLPHEIPAREIMSQPVRGCEQNQPLEEALQQMIFSDIQSIFVYKHSPGNITGILSLSEVARARSGSCKACLASRIQIEEPV